MAGEWQDTRGSTPPVVPGAAPALANAGVGGYFYRYRYMTYIYIYIYYTHIFNHIFLYRYFGNYRFSNVGMQFLKGQPRASQARKAITAKLTEADQCSGEKPDATSSDRQ